MNRKATTIPVNRQREFRPEELFFSITDERGVIRHGNEVFTRISGYAEEELFGAPHSLIRHPDMPRCVFQLLWETIREGNTIAAYVKNMASDGCYYWVLAVVMPCRNGYLSIRLKPTTNLLDIVNKVYGQLKEVEAEVETKGGNRVAAMEASRSALLSGLSSLGFADYGSFMMHALASELSSRQQILEQSNDESHLHHRSNLRAASLGRMDLGYDQWDALLQTAFEQLGQFQTIGTSLLSKSDSIRINAENMRIISMNASIAANKLGDKAATLRVVADSLGYTSTDTCRIVNQLTSRMTELAQVLTKLVFDVASTKLQSEVGTQFSAEMKHGQAENERFHQSLSILHEELVLRTKKILHHISWTKTELVQLLAQITRLEVNYRALRFVRFAGIKESVDAEVTRVFSALFAEVQNQITQTQIDCDFLLYSMRKTSTNIKQLEKTFSFATKAAKSA